MADDVMKHEDLLKDLHILRTRVKDLEREKRHIQESAPAFSSVQNEWEHTFNAIPDPIMIVDTKHRVVRVNKAMADSVGHNPEEILGRRCFEVVHGSAGPISCCPHSHLLRDGLEHFAEVFEPRIGRIYTVSVSPVHDASGSLIGCVHVARDITALKKAQEDLLQAGRELEKRVEERTAELSAATDQLRREIREREVAQEELRCSEERFRAIFESARDVIFLKDLDHRYTHVNPAMESLFVRPSSEIVGLNAEDLYGAWPGRHIREVELRVLAGDFVEEEHSRPVNGVQLTFHDIRVPLKDASGAIVGLCGMSRDITDRKHVSELSLPSYPDYSSQSMQKTLEAAQLAATSDSLVLLTGESGTGKTIWHAIFTITPGGPRVRSFHSIARVCPWNWLNPSSSAMNQVPSPCDRPFPGARGAR